MGDVMLERQAVRVRVRVRVGVAADERCDVREASG